MSKTELVKACKVSVKTIDAWVNKGCPHTRRKDGQYQFEFKKVQAWRVATMPTRPATSANVLAYSEARARKETALAGLRELQLKERLGELVRKDAVEKEEFEVARRVRDALENIPARVSGPCAAAKDQHEIFSIIAIEIRQCLEDLTREKDRDEQDPKDACDARTPKPR